MYCQVCGCAEPTAHVRFDKHFGFILFWQHGHIKGYMCRSCGKQAFAEYFFPTLFLGYWSYVSIIVGPCTLIYDLIQLCILMAKTKMPADSHPTQQNIQLAAPAVLNEPPPSQPVAGSRLGAMSLTLGGKRISMRPGSTISTQDIPQLNPQQGNTLGTVYEVSGSGLELRNESYQSWRATDPSGSSAIIKPGESIKLEAGFALAMGPTTAQVQAY